MVAQNEGNHEEGNAQEYSNAGNQVNEMVNFLSNWSLAGVQTRCQTSNTAHDGVITATDDNALGGTFDSIC